MTSPCPVCGSHGWRDIESAPKDGRMLTFSDEWGVAEALRFDDGTFGLATFNGTTKTFFPTMWQPLPGAPK